LKSCLWYKLGQTNTLAYYTLVWIYKLKGFAAQVLESNTCKEHHYPFIDYESETAGGKKLQHSAFLSFQPNDRRITFLQQPKK
jgi:hypothetical protein